MKGLVVIHSKKVEMAELFYDLVFAYAILCLTAILETASGTGFSLPSAGFYVLSFVILVNSWMYQMVFTNRYGRKTVTDTLATYAQAAVLLFVASSLTENLLALFRPFALGVGMLSLLLFAEYGLAYFREKDEEDRHLILRFLRMTGLRTLLILTGAFLPVRSGVWVSLSGVLAGWLLPAFFSGSMKVRPVDFGHLSERLSLLVILMFGDMIISLAGQFRPDTFRLSSVLAFLLCASLFSCYASFCDRFAKDETKPLTGVAIIYLHYPILAGLNLITNALHYLPDSGIPLWQSGVFLVTGLICFFAGLYGCCGYLKPEYRSGSGRLLPYVTVFLLIVPILNLTSAPGILLVTALTGTALQIFVMERCFRHPEPEDPHKSLFSL